MRAVIAVSFDDGPSAVSRLAAYARYADAAGLRPLVATVARRNSDRPLNLSGVTLPDNTAVVSLTDLDPRDDDIVVFSAPDSHRAVVPRYGRRRFLPHQIVQSAHAASPLRDEGYGYRLVAQRMSRTVTSPGIAREIDAMAGPVEMEVVHPAYDLDGFFRVASRSRNFVLALDAAAARDQAVGEAIDRARERGSNVLVRIVDPSMPRQERASNLKGTSAAFIKDTVGEGLCQYAIEACAAGAALLIEEGEAARNLPEGVEPAAVIPFADTLALSEALVATVQMPDVIHSWRRQSQSAIRQWNQRSTEAQAIPNLFAKLMIAARSGAPAL